MIFQKMEQVTSNLISGKNKTFRNKLSEILSCASKLVNFLISILIFIQQPSNTISQAFFLFRIKNLFEFTENEKRKQQEMEERAEETAEDLRMLAEIQENISTAITTAKVANKRIKDHVKHIKSREQKLNSKYDNFIHAVKEREEEICKLVLRLGQSYRDIIEHDRKQMQLAFQEEVQGAKESKWFLSNCYHKFKDILSSEQMPNQQGLIMLQLDAAVAQISKENFQIPEWRVPRLDMVPVSQEDKRTVHSMIGRLVIDRKAPSVGKQSCGSLVISEDEDEEQDSRYHSARENNTDSSSDIGDETEQDLPTELFQVGGGSEEEQDDDRDDEEEDETVLTEHCHRKGLLALRRKRKKIRKHIKIGCALLNQTVVAGISLAIPSTASKNTNQNNNSEEERLSTLV